MEPRNYFLKGKFSNLSETSCIFLRMLKDFAILKVHILGLYKTIKTKCQLTGTFRIDEFMCFKLTRIMF